MDDASLDLGFEQQEKIKKDEFDTDFNSSTASPSIGDNSGAVAEIFYAPESSSRLSFSNDKDETSVIGENSFDEKEIEKAIKLGVEEEEKESGGDDNHGQEENTGVLDADWKEKEKHIFILSEAGKPIYTL